PDGVARRYPPSDTSLAARYARAIAAYRFYDPRGAQAQIDALIQAQPQNPYFYELKGQALLEAGKPAEAIAPLRHAVQLAPNPALIQIMLGQALVATRDRAHVDEAVSILQVAVLREPESPDLYSQLAMAYGQKNDVARAQTQSFSGDQRREIERIVKDYLLSNPELLQDVMNELEKRQATAEAEKHRASVKEHSAALFSSPRQVTLGNPQGDVTVVEFFDYNCGYCKRAMNDMLDLLKSDGKLKFVLKEFPVLGEGSVQAAQVAAAARMQDKSGKKYLEFHQKLLGGRGQADKARALAAAKDVGLDVAQIEKDMTSDEVKATIEESFKLADALGLNGTPSYVVGNDVVVGAVGLNSLKEKVNAARCGKPTC